MKYFVLVMTICSFIISGSAYADTGKIVISTEKSLPQTLKELGISGVLSIMNTVLKCVPKDNEAKPERILKPGEKEPYDRIFGYCYDNNRMAIFVSGINFKLIKAFKKEGVPVEWIRAQLADPKVLQSVKGMANMITKLLVFSSRQGELPFFANLNSNETGPISNSTKKDMRQFIYRRMSEAKFKDRPEIAKLWGEIFKEQFTLFKKSPSEELIPSFLLDSPSVEKK